MMNPELNEFVFYEFKVNFSGKQVTKGDDGTPASANWLCWNILMNNLLCAQPRTRCHLEGS